MKELFIVANWKSNKNLIQAKDWVERFTNYDLRFTNKDVVICPSFVHLSVLKSYISDYKSNIKLGAQDISPFDNGAYTGEVCGSQIKEFADYVIIGHSERRKYFKEDEEILRKKVAMAISANLLPIFCVENPKMFIPEGVKIVAYEPIEAIGTGNPDTPENAEKTASEIKSNLNGIPVLYGGSITSENVKSFTQMQGIDGVLVGGASLDPLEFSKIVEVS
ncbi:MAG: triose-phosphate isomerase family protein [Candidatus Levybacteria bacterium]|nr:triose-phosphate isomerase family protein [Candidatus Levybacteria bacterium]